MTEVKFTTITGDDWKREIKRARETPNQVSLNIKKKLAERPTTDQIMEKLFPNDPHERQ